MQNGWKVDSVAGSWSMLLNCVNFVDACLHALYAATAVRELSSFWAAAGPLPAGHMYCD